MDVTETMLPGVGMRYEFTTANGERMAVISYRDGHMDLVAYDDEDPDESIGMVRLARTEVETVAEILGAPRITSRVADLTKEVPGLVSAHIELPADSTYVDGPLGETKCRTRTGTSIVAIVRDDHVLSSPQPEDVLKSGDTLVAIGSEEGIDALRVLLGALP